MATTLVRNWKLFVAWAVSLVIVGALTAAAQQQVPRAPFLTVAPEFVSGNDLGFRIERTVEGVPVGKLVIRVDGRWVDVVTPSTNGSAAR